MILGLFAKYWSPKECLIFFHKFARSIFQPKTNVTKSLYGMIKRIFSSYIADGKYNVSTLEMFLKEALGMALIFMVSIQKLTTWVN